VIVVRRDSSLAEELGVAELGRLAVIVDPGRHTRRVDDDDGTISKQNADFRPF
jgi:hypothetical protein